MSANFYTISFFEDNVIPFIRIGMQVPMTNDFLTINGLGKYKIYTTPETIENLNNLDEAFKDYTPSIPWVGKENDGKIYLYRIGIQEDRLNFVKTDGTYKYAYIKAKSDEEISVLNGKIFFRTFIDDEQTALIRCEEATMIQIEKEEGLVMIELVDGNFICR